MRLTFSTNVDELHFLLLQEFERDEEVVHLKEMSEQEGEATNVVNAHLGLAVRARHFIFFGGDFGNELPEENAVVETWTKGGGSRKE